MIQFKKVIVHNFGSYGHAELELQNKGFCLVSGQNKYIKDNALSNGSGKSFLWSAVCFALTGETINGIKTNLKNINTEDPECYVQLDFLYRKDLFSIIRTVTPKSDLKVFKNDVDLSGKGIRESEKKLQELLPDLNKDLIASTIIIGQGMPNKFSSFSPSGRKELLEKLTKSDFMIEDLKMRIQARMQELSVKIREFEDSLIINKTQLNNHLNNLEKIKASLENQQQPDFDKLLDEQKSKIASLQQEVIQHENTLKTLETQIEELNTRLVMISEEKAKVSSEELSAYTASYTKLSEEKTKFSFNIANLTKEITKLKAITDTCPTCGQHLPNVQKPDTQAQESALQEATNALNIVETNIIQCNQQHQEYINQINTAFNDEINTLNTTLTETKQILNTTKSKHSICMSSLEAEKTLYNKLLYDKQNWDVHLKKQQNEIGKLELEIARLTNLIAITSLSKEDFDQRIAIIKKMDSLIRRDFRGYLLTNIITYIDNRAKDYCSTVFGTRDLSLTLNGNALDITYCGKLFDGLSGGEKQRVDLILQLAIRDLLTSYLGLSANILVLDEITDFLDKRSCQAVMQLLEKELQTVESVFIISHHAEELELPVDSEIKVIKNEHGISELC
jgi:DNA repair exonuclease SbcCD ATPase subunit